MGVVCGVMPLSVGCVLYLCTTLNVAILFRDIDEISKNITVMLMDQGGVVENVEANVNSIDDRVDDGTEELKKVGACSSTPLSCCSEN